jgi:hypothetical protein
LNLDQIDSKEENHLKHINNYANKELIAEIHTNNWQKIKDEDSITIYTK